MDKANDYFNPAAPTVLHVDLNSCFATVEQQANPLLRHRPMAVAAYTTPNGCVLAASVDAKKRGCKTGMRVKDCKQLCPELVIVPPDFNKYRFVHLKFRKILEDYSDRVAAKSVDEFVIHMENTPALKRGIVTIAQEIKQRIKDEIGNYLTVSAGIAPNRSLAKLAAGLHKPDGLDSIDSHNFRQIYQSLDLIDLPGINIGYKTRLARVGVFTVMEMFQQSMHDMHAGFKSVVGDDWFARLRGWEVDNIEFGRKSFSNTHTVKVPIINPDHIFPVMANLAWKASSRMRIAGFHCFGVMLGFRYRNGQRAYAHCRAPHPIFSGSDIITCLKKLFYQLPRDYVSNVDVGVFDLTNSAQLQLNYFDNLPQKQALYQAVDAIEHAWGRNTIHPATMLPATMVLNRVAFGGGKDMEAYVFNGDSME